jgi:hypothetical protein
MEIDMQLEHFAFGMVSYAPPAIRMEVFILSSLSSLVTLVDIPIFPSLLRGVITMIRRQRMIVPMTKPASWATPH